MSCRRPPKGWRCTRLAGHDGPCAAWPVARPDWSGIVGLIFAVGFGIVVGLLLAYLVLV